MKIFFDTEFTGLHKHTTLISIGLVDENERVFYAEFTDYDRYQVDEWIKEHVIDNLLYKHFDKEGEPNTISIFGNKYYAKGDKRYIKNQLIEWLSEYDNVELVSDVCHYDMVLFIDLFGTAFDLPQNVNPACHDINQDIARYYEISEKEAFDFSREEILQNNAIIIDGYKHNSLYDAKVIKTIYEIIKSHGLL
jgi:hypothetical protein